MIETTQKRNQKEISNLCKKSLKKKWFKNSEKDIIDDCPFCEDANFYSKQNEDEDECYSCLCPPEICKDHGEEGYISQIKIIAKDILIRKGYFEDLDDGCEPEFNFNVGDLPEEVLNHMRDLFKKYIIED